MKRRFLSIFMVIALCFVCIFAISGCDFINSGNGGNGDGIQGEILEISLNETSLTLSEGRSETLVATVKLKIDGVELTVKTNNSDQAVNVNVEWESSDTSVATVENGNVSTIKEGTANITAKAGSKSATCDLTVKHYEPVDFEMPEGGYDGSKVTITFANTTGQDKARIIEEAIEDFNELYPNITVLVDNSIKSYDELSKRILTELVSGKQPNVAFCYPDHVALYNRANAVVAIDDFLSDGQFKNMTVTNSAGVEPLGLTQAQQNDYVQAFFDEGSVYGDGHTYTLPFAKSTEVMYYNKDFFDEHHLTVPATWDEMETVCKQIQGIIGKKNGKYPLGYDSDANLFITMCEQYNSPYISATGDHFLFDNAKNQEFVKDLVDLYNDDCLITQSTNNDRYVSNLFTQENCFMSIGSSAGSSYHYADFNIGVAPIPQVDISNPKSTLQGPSVCIFRDENPQEVLASWLFVKFLTTDVQLQCRYSEASGYMPVTKSAYNNEIYQEYLSATSLPARTAKLCAELEKRNVFFTTPAFVGSSKAYEQVGLLMKTALLGGNIEEAFKQAVDACNLYIAN